MERGSDLVVQHLKYLQPFAPPPSFPPPLKTVLEVFLPRGMSCYVIVPEAPWE